MRPKHGLVLDSNLHWKRATECSGSGSGFALGLEMGDALNVASWESLSSEAKTVDQNFFQNGNMQSSPDRELQKPHQNLPRTAKYFLSYYAKEKNSISTHLLFDNF